MSPSRSQRRLWRHPYVFVAALLLFAAGLTTVGATFASFTSETDNGTSAFAGGWLAPATALSVTPSGYNGVLAWSPGKHGLDGQQVFGVDNGTSASCPASGYSNLATTASATTATYTESTTTLDNPRSNVNGHYVCYQLVSTRSGSSWTATASFPATVLGLVPTAVSYAGNPLTSGSTFTLSYNQPIAYTGGTIEVCIGGTPVVVFGSNASCTASIGSLAGGSAGKTITCTTSTVAVTNGTQLLITLGGCPNGNGNQATMSGGPVTYTATGATVGSSVGAVPQCTTTLCKPQMATW